jgi:hypothetical protein
MHYRVYFVKSKIVLAAYSNPQQIRNKKMPKLSDTETRDKIGIRI